jgi:hypothetical protein
MSKNKNDISIRDINADTILYRLLFSLYFLPTVEVYTKI